MRISWKSRGKIANFNKRSQKTRILSKVSWKNCTSSKCRRKKENFVKWLRRKGLFRLMIDEKRGFHQRAVKKSWISTKDRKKTHIPSKDREMILWDLSISWKNRKNAIFSKNRRKKLFRQKAAEKWQISTKNRTKKKEKVEKKNEKFKNNLENIVYTVLQKNKSFVKGSQKTWISLNGHNQTQISSKDSGKTLILP